jgi:iron(III) transport system ATP-binding protein
VGRPQALLFDEPLSNLDAKLRIDMRNELRLIQRQSGLTAIYVTHDQAEALAISDWIIVMKDGRIVERGRPVDIYRRPRHVFTAQFLGATNLIAGTVAEVDGAGQLAVVTAVGRILGIDPTGTLSPGAKVKISIRPEDLSTRTAAGAAVNTIEGRMTFAAFAGAAVEAELRCGEINIACLLDRDADLTPGRAITLRAKADACLVLPEE